MTMYGEDGNIRSWFGIDENEEKKEYGMVSFLLSCFKLDPPAGAKDNVQEHDDNWDIENVKEMVR